MREKKDNQPSDRPPNNSKYPDLRELVTVFEGFHFFCRLFFVSINPHVSEPANIVARNFVGRGIVTLRSMFALFMVQDYQNCWVLYRIILERALLLNHLRVNNQFEQFRDYSFIEDYEIRNRIRSDPKFQDRIDKEFFRDSDQVKKQYANLKQNGVYWSRPAPEAMAKAMDSRFLYIHGYDYASCHVHPLAVDGQADFFRFMELEDKDSVEEQLASLHNGALSMGVLLNQALGATTPKWLKIAYDYLFAVLETLSGESVFDENWNERLKVAFEGNGNSLCAKHKPEAAPSSKASEPVDPK